MVGSVGQSSPLVKNHYRRIIREMMAQYGIASLHRPDHVVRPETSFEGALQNTDWYVVGEDNIQAATLYRRPHYRHNRYMEALQHIPDMDVQRLAHIDIGCGAGLFSWVFLDWARTNGIGYDRIDLHGYDHSPQMIRIATESRNRLMQTIPDYPSLHYDFDTFRRRLYMTHHPDKDYIVTFGYVLAQTYVWTRSSIADFARVIGTISELRSDEPICELVSVDSTGRQQRNNSIAGWNLLLDNLREQHNLHAWQNNPRDSMYALLADNPPP